MAEKIENSQKPRIAVSYIRYSHPSQNANNSSYNRQIELSKSYCKANNLVLNDDIFFDQGISAYHSANSKFSEHELTRFLKLLEDKIINCHVLIIESLDRISRDEIFIGQMIMGRILQCNVDIYSCVDNKLYTRQSLNDAPSLIGMVLEFSRSNSESKNKSLRVASGWAEKRRLMQAGIVYTKKKPLWLDVKDNVFTVNSNIDTIKLIFDLFLKGNTYEGIAVYLGKNGYRTAKHGVLYTNVALRKLIRDTRLIGTRTLYKLNGKKQVEDGEVLNYYPIAISEDTFYQAQSKCRVSQVKGRQNGTIKNIFSGLLFCKRCGNSLLTTNKNQYSYIVCKTAKFGGGCQYNSVRLDKFEETILRWAKDELVQALNSTAINQDSRSLQNEIIVIQTKIDTNKNKLLKLMETFSEESDIDVQDSFQLLIKKFSSELKKLKADLAEKESSVKAGDVQVNSENIKILVEGSENRVILRNAVRSILDKIIVDKDNIQIFLKGGSIRYLNNYISVKSDGKTVELESVPTTQEIDNSYRDKFKKEWKPILEDEVQQIHESRE
jgi:DNA invertase Pin-like site-specific DNA recombinase